jgi:anaerobic sulfite reductase subunit C
VHNTKKIAKNAFRISKVRGESAIRLRIPGGDLDARHLETIKKLAEKFGNGTVHLSIRQGFEIPGIKLAQLEEIKEFMARMIYDIEKESNVILDSPQAGYPSAGTRNVSACIGDRVCRFANCDAPLLARKIEGIIYPNDYHLKVAVTACPNDCIKAHLQDIGIISGVVPDYDDQKCIACEACLDNCTSRVTNALQLKNHKIIRDQEYCLKCGECILECPAGALVRGKSLYRIIAGGRTGKRNPRLANTFIEDASEEVVLAVCKNVYFFIHRNINSKLPKEHLGYIIDRTGFDVFAQEITQGISLNPEAKVVKLDNPGYFYKYRR